MTPDENGAVVDLDVGNGHGGAGDHLVGHHECHLDLGTTVTVGVDEKGARFTILNSPNEWTSPPNSRLSEGVLFLEVRPAASPSALRASTHRGSPQPLPDPGSRARLAPAWRPKREDRRSDLSANSTSCPRLKPPVSFSRIGSPRWVGPPYQMRCEFS